MICKQFTNLAFFRNYVNRLKPLNWTSTYNSWDNNSKWVAMIPIKSLSQDNKKDQGMI